MPFASLTKFMLGKVLGKWVGSHTHFANAPASGEIFIFARNFRSYLMLGTCIY